MNWGSVQTVDGLEVLAVVFAAWAYVWLSNLPLGRQNARGLGRGDEDGKAQRTEATGRYVGRESLVARGTLVGPDHVPAASPVARLVAARK